MIDGGVKSRLRGCVKNMDRLILRVNSNASALCSLGVHDTNHS